MLKNFNINCRNNRNISIFTSISYHSVFTRPPFLFFQHNQQYDTIVTCIHLYIEKCVYIVFRYSYLFIYLFSNIFNI